MSLLLNDALNVRLLKLLCEGKGLHVNISELSHLLGRHRNTILNRFNTLIEHKVIEEPFQPFPRLFFEYPLLVIEKVHLARDVKTNTWIELDPAIWAAFFVRDEEYNTLMFELHKDLYAYQQWRDRAVQEELITLPPGRDYYQAAAIYISTSAIIKNDSVAPMRVLEADFNANRIDRINGVELDEQTIRLMDALINGKCIHVNPNELSAILGVHRRTIQRRVQLLEQASVITSPVCRFPRIWASPTYFMVLSLLQIQKHRERVLKALAEDPHVALLARISTDRYNVLMCSTFLKMEDHLAWEEQYDQRFSDSLNAVRNLYLSPAMTFSIHQQFVALAFLDQRLKEIRGQELLTRMQQHRPRRVRLHTRRSSDMEF